MARTNTKPSAGVTVLEFDTEKIKEREKQVGKETDEQILGRLKERFDILSEMTKAVKRGDVRAMIISGPPGVGKSYGVERWLVRRNRRAQAQVRDRQGCNECAGLVR